NQIFVSSRRPHTRSKRDWSSDVCSSDLLFAGKKAPLNPWNANTLEWTAASPPPHLNWGPTLPTVYRGPYEYSSPESTDDWLPQRSEERRVGREGGCGCASGVMSGEGECR